MTGVGKGEWEEEGKEVGGGMTLKILEFFDIASSYGMSLEILH